MQVRFLGTSHAIPTATRCCCSLLLTVGDRNYLFDGGAPVTEQLARLGIPNTSVKAFFATHLHSDHITGALPFFSLFNWYYKSAELDVYLPEQRGVTLIRDYLAFTDGEPDPARLRFHVFDETLRYDDGTVNVTAIRTLHLVREGNRPSFAFIISAEGKKLLFTGDLTHKLADFPEILYREDFDLLVTENAHCTTELLLEKLNGIKAKRVAVIHIKSDPERFRKLEEAKSSVPFDLTVPDDGDLLEFQNEI